MEISTQWRNSWVTLAFALAMALFTSEVMATTTGDINWLPGIGGSATTNNSVRAIVRKGANIYIAGTFTSVEGVSASRIAKWNGTTWSAMGSGMNGDVYALAVDSSNNVYAGGAFTTAGGVTVNRIAKWNGSSWSALGTGMDDTVYSLLIDINNNVYAGGAFITAGGTTVYRIAKWNGSWAALGTGIPTASSSVNAMAINSSGSLYVAGSFTTAGAVTANRVALWNGTAWSAVSTAGMNNTVFALAYVSGNLYAGGAFTTAGGSTRNYIARWTGTTWSALGTGMNSEVYTLAADSSNNIYAGGAFTTAAGAAANRIAVWNGSAWSALGSGLNQSARALGLDSAGNLVVGGTFTTAGATPANYLARWLLVDTDSDGLGDIVDSDDDNDGMPDTWEILYGLNPLVNDASADLDGDGITNLQEFTNGSNPTTVVTVKNDYTDNSIAGWIWKGQHSGKETLSEIWQLTFPLYSANWSIPSRFYPPPFADQANWDIVTTGDFNKDGDADILWRHNTLATWKVWQMQNGLRVAQNAPADFDLAHEWRVVGAGDTDKDGDDDVILNKTSTGAVMIWEMQNHAVVATRSVGTKAGYVLNRIGDFNKDGDVDLLFRQNGGDVLVTWELQANAFVAERALASTGTNWSPVCAGDFDADGDDDIMLMNSSTTQEKWFVIENYTRTQAFGSYNTGFVFQGCGDYDGDGDADIKSQRSSDDMNRIVLQTNVLLGTGVLKQTVYTNPYGGVNPGADGYGFVYRGNSN